jgi:hypothetical protein
LVQVQINDRFVRDYLKNIKTLLDEKARRTLEFSSFRVAACEIGQHRTVDDAGDGNDDLDPLRI